MNSKKIIAFGLTSIALMGALGCAKSTKNPNLTNNTNVSNTNYDWEPKVFAPGEHTIVYREGGEYSSSKDIVEIPYIEGYQVIGVIESLYVRNGAVYQNVVEVSVEPTRYVKGEGYKYEGFGSPTTKENTLSLIP